MSSSTYPWKFCSVGGVTRVRISSGEDIAHISELDQKLWTALSCPVVGLEFNQEFLNLLDSDHDGRIRVKEVVAACEKICSLITDRDLLLKSSETLPLDAINTSCEEGARLKRSATQILKSLGKEAAEISLSDSSDASAIFAKTIFNGDGIIVPDSAEDDTAARKAIEACLKCFPALKDRSGADGVDAATVESFYAALEGYLAWHKSFDKDSLPYKEATSSALDAVETLAGKIDEYFKLCDFFAYAPESDQAKESADSLSHPNTEKLLHFDAINPVWAGAFAALKSTVLDLEYPEAQTLSRPQWEKITGKLASYKNWKAAKTGAEVEALGIEAIEELTGENKKTDILSLIGKDCALSEEASQIENVHNLILVYRYIYEFLNNFVIFGAFYDREQKAVFDAGVLYIDQRCLKLCIKINDMGKQSTMAPLSGMYIIYCDCVSKKTGRTANIAAVLTNGDTDNLCVGMNAVFYDRDGVDYDATVTKIIDNPTSVRQAFFHPYKKFSKAISERINKRAAEKESKVSTGLNDLANNAGTPAATPVSTGKKAFDPTTLVALTAGIGVGAGVILNAVSALVKPWYTLLLVIVGLCLVISGPSMFLAWVKLRKRNLGPILNANGWAINSSVIVNSLFGATLTSLAKYPKLLAGTDPFVAKKKSPLPKILFCLLLLAGIGYLVWKFIYVPAHTPELISVPETIGSAALLLFKRK